ncbi:MAG: 30S ribosomal protein S20 [Halanaerobium sp.]
MPIIKSAKKRVKVTEKKTAQNKEWKERLKNAIKDMEKAVEAGDKEAAAEQLKETKKVIDKAVTRNILHKNNAARKKSRLTKMYNNM